MINNHSNSDNNSIENRHSTSNSSTDSSDYNLLEILKAKTIPSTINKNDQKSMTEKDSDNT